MPPPVLSSKARLLLQPYGFVSNAKDGHATRFLSLASLLCLESHRAPAALCRVKSSDIPKAKQRFNDGSAPAIALGVYQADHARDRHMKVESLARILACAIKMKDQSRRGSQAKPDHTKGFDDGGR